MIKKKEKQSFVKLERRLLESREYRLVSARARDLYTCMLNSLHNDNNGRINVTPRRVHFGPMDAQGFGIAKTSFYRLIDRLIYFGIIEELEPGGHGKKAVYDLEAWKYNLD